MKVLTQQDNGTHIELAAGSSLTVRLPENPTTGYRWIVESSEGLQPISSDYQGGDAVGAAGFRTFEFRGNRVGSCQLRLLNRREWETQEAPLDTFQATVVFK